MSIEFKQQEQSGISLSNVLLGLGLISLAASLTAQAMLVKILLVLSGAALVSIKAYAKGYVIGFDSAVVRMNKELSLATEQFMAQMTQPKQPESIDPNLPKA